MQAARTSIALFILSVGSATANNTTTVDFESGAEGWVGPTGGGGNTFIDPTGGNGGGAGLHTVFTDFGITFFNNTNSAFLGDYTQFDQVTISMDIIVHELNFLGLPTPRPWLVELRDFDTAQAGYPWTSVWFLFDTISESGNSSWTTYSVTIADPTSTTLPAGWEGYGAEDPVTFEPILPPGVTFADVLSGVDEMAFTTFQPGFFFSSSLYDIVVDNISITTESSGSPVNYCTAGISASGCQATLSTVGTPSASAPSGFLVNASNVEGSKDGLYFFGVNGRQAVSWGNGTSFRCVAPPVSRAGLLTGTGTNGLCDGAFSQDLNARWQAKPATNPGAGTTTQLQLWYRDPNNTSNQTSSMSDAIEFDLGV